MSEPLTLEDLCAAAFSGAGQSYEVFTRRFSESVQKMVSGLPEDEAAIIIAQAVSLGYEPPAVVADIFDQLANSGL